MHTLSARMHLLPAAFLLIAASCAAQQYTVLDLGTLGGASSEALAINDPGQITGLSEGADHQSTAFLYQHGAMQSIGSLGGGFSEGASINNQGQITGTSATLDGNDDAFFYNGSMIDLGTLVPSKIAMTQDSAGYGVNNAGQVVGYSGRTSKLFQGFLYTGGSLEQIANLPGFSYLWAYAINDSGVIVGSALKDDSDSAQQAFQSDGQTTIALASLPGSTFSVADAVNSSGVIAGYSGQPGSTSHMVKWANGLISDLGVPAGFATSEGLAINAAGEIVGDGTRQQFGDASAIFWNPLTGMIDLNTEIPASSGWILTSAAGINSHEQIVGYGVHGGQLHAFLLNPNSLAILKKYIFELAKGIEGCIQCKVVLDGLASVLPPDTATLSAAQRTEAIIDTRAIVVVVNRLTALGELAPARSSVVVHEANEVLVSLQAATRSVTGAQ